MRMTQSGFFGRLTGESAASGASFPNMVTRGELASYPYYGDWWFIDSVKDLKEVEVSLRSNG